MMIISLTASGNTAVHTISFAWSIQATMLGAIVSNSTVGFCGARAFYLLPNSASNANEPPAGVTIDGFSVYGMNSNGIAVYAAGSPNLVVANGNVRFCSFGLFTAAVLGSGENPPPDQYPTGLIADNIVVEDASTEAFQVRGAHGASLSSLKAVRPRVNGIRVRESIDAKGVLLDVIDNVGTNDFLFENMVNPNFSLLSGSNGSGTGLRLTQSGSSPVDWDGQFTNIHFKGHTGASINIGANVTGNRIEGKGAGAYVVNAASTNNEIVLHNRTRRHVVTGGSGTLTWAPSLAQTWHAREMAYTEPFTANRQLRLNRTAVTEGLPLLVRRPVASGSDAYTVDIVDNTSSAAIGSVPAGGWALIRFVDGEYRRQMFGA